MEPWYKVITPRKEVREGRSFNPDEFAIALEQVVAGTAPKDYKDPAEFFARTCFTRALREHCGMILRRLSGKTENTAPVVTLITQFGGGKTHTLTALYHLTHNAKISEKNEGVSILLKENGLSNLSNTKVAVFVGNAWDPKDGKETPWIDIARQLAGDEGVAILGKSAKTTPPGTDTLTNLYKAAGGSVLILCDEVLNFINRHRGMADGFHSFIQNTTVSMTGTTHSAAVISLPRSQVEMTDWDLQWQEKIAKVVRRVAKDLIANDETEISEVVRRRLFEDIGPEKVRKTVALAYANWCFERRAQLPAEWTAVDTAATETNAREFLRERFESCYPFHPATLSVFQRKWQTLPQYQQTRGTLAMFAQWIAWAYKEGYQHARKEPLLTLGSAPLDVPEFRSVILGQLGEARLAPSIETDIAGRNSHARALDADTKGALKDIHRRVATTILFESSGGMTDKVAHLPEIRFALGEPDLDTTSVDTAALALESKAFFIRKIGTDGFQIRYQPTLKKVVSDRRASLDDAEVKKEMLAAIRKEFEQGSNIPLVFFPKDSSEVQDSPRLTLVVMGPNFRWEGEREERLQIGKWTKERGVSPRLYPGSLIWCIQKPGRELLDKVEMMLAWRHVNQEISSGILGGDFDRSERLDIAVKVKDAEESVKDEVWAAFRFVAFFDTKEPEQIRVLDLGAGHASAAETLPGRIITALRSQALLNESVGAGYLERNWPPALKDVGAWPLSSLRQSFLSGALTRLIDPDTVLRSKILEFVSRGDFGLASGQKQNGCYERVWFKELLPPDEIVFDSNLFLLLSSKAKALKLSPDTPVPVPPVGPVAPPLFPEAETEEPGQEGKGAHIITISGTIPPELWNRFGTKILPKIRQAKEVKLGLNFSATYEGKGDSYNNLIMELNQLIDDLGLADKIKIEVTTSNK